jgi:hypothetical protein
MDTQDVRTRSSGKNPSHDDADASRQYGLNWPFPLDGEPKAWTAKQEKAYKTLQLSEMEEALV